MSHRVIWKRRGGPPRGIPDPRYPKGMDLDMTNGAQKTCFVALPYPTRKVIGFYTVHCEECGLITGITTAGRPDDPRSVKLPCKETQQ